MFKEYQVEKLAAPLLLHMSKGIQHEIDDVILGNVVGPGGNVARLSALEAGFPYTVPGVTVDRQCGAGLEAVRMACHFIQGEREVVILPVVLKVQVRHRSNNELVFHPIISEILIWESQQNM